MIFQHFLWMLQHWLMLVGRQQAGRGSGWFTGTVSGIPLSWYHPLDLPLRPLVCSPPVFWGQRLSAWLLPPTPSAVVLCTRGESLIWDGTHIARLVLADACSSVNFSEEYSTTSMKDYFFPLNSQLLSFSLEIFLVLFWLYFHSRLWGLSATQDAIGIFPKQDFCSPSCAGS